MEIKITKINQNEYKHRAYEIVKESGLFIVYEYGKRIFTEKTIADVKHAISCDMVI